MTQEETQKAVLRKVTEGNPNGSDFVVLDFKTTFLDGMLFTVGFTENEKKWTNRVYVESKNFHLYRNDEILLSALGSKSRKGIIETIMSPQSSSGGIAFLIVATIAFLVYRNPDTPKIPDILSQALTLILGFYFGSAKTRD